MAEDGSTMIVKYGAFSIKTLIPKPNANPLELSLNKVEYWDILNFLTEPDDCAKYDSITNAVNFDISPIVNRYEELRQEGEMLAVPCTDKIANCIVIPLKNAKACYMIGNFLGTIALCGYVCEMLIVLVYEINGIVINDTDIEDNKEIKNVILQSRNSFEALGQEKIIDICKAFQLITLDQKNLFVEVKEIRNKYLHWFSTNNHNVSNDAKEIYNKTYLLLKQIIGYNFEDNKFSFDNKFESFLKEKGLIKSPTENTPK
ncbi:MAG: hypothetical protein KA140_00950 [Caldisericia bacterium]|nr:hypothetical protein [Caldisericia bacterium]